MRNAIPVVLAFWIAATIGAAGAPLKCADVGAEPARLLHVDFDAMRSTYIGQYLLYQLSKPQFHSNMVAFESVFSFDLRKQLHGVTVYSASSTPKESVVIIYADFEPTRFVKLITGGAGAFTITNNQRVIYSWIDKNKNPDGVRKYGAILDGRVIVGDTQRSIVDALAVVDGNAPGFSPGKAKEFESPGATNFVLAIARNLDFAGLAPGVALLKLSKQVKFQASESDEMLRARLTVNAPDAQTAKQMSQVVEGWIATLGLQKENPSAAKLAEGMKVAQDGSGFRVDASVSSKDVMAALKAYNHEKNPPRPLGN